MDKDRNTDKTVVSEQVATDGAREAWSKPEIVSYKPASSAQGISYRPNDGISNLTA